MASAQSPRINLVLYWLARPPLDSTQLCLLWTTHFIICLCTFPAFMRLILHIWKHLISVTSTSSWAIAESSSELHDCRCTQHSTRSQFSSWSLSPNLHSAPFFHSHQTTSVVKSPICQVLHCINGPHSPYSPEWHTGEKIKVPLAEVDYRSTLSHPGETLSTASQPHFDHLNEVQRLHQWMNEQQDVLMTRSNECLTYQLNSDLSNRQMIHHVCWFIGVNYISLNAF